MHLFPLHALPVQSSNTETEPRYLLDIFPKGVSYAPSCQLLQQVQTRQRSDFDKLFTVQTPTEDLYEEDLGAVGAIKKQFSHSNILRKGKATEDIAEVIEVWVQSPNNSQVQQAYRTKLTELTTSIPTQPGIELGPGNMKSKTPVGEPNPTSRELLDNIMIKNKPSTDENSEASSSGS